jgi:uncharacterized RDD family membrane protein YckC
MNCTNHPDVITGVVRCGRCGRPYCQDCVVELDGRPYDAACKEEQIRDLRSGTAELAYASSLRRLGAIFIDTFLLAILVRIISSFATGLFTKDQPAGALGFVFLIGFVVQPLCFCVYEGLITAKSGQTLGKRALGIRAVNADGSDMEGNTCWKRAGARFFVTVTIILSLVDSIMIFSENHRTLRDRFATTVVVRT